MENDIMINGAEADMEYSSVITEAPQSFKTSH